jgi:hypothetical protein
MMPGGDGPALAAGPATPTPSPELGGVASSAAASRPTLPVAMPAPTTSPAPSLEPRVARGADAAPLPASGAWWSTASAGIIAAARGGAAFSASPGASDAARPPTSSGVERSAWEATPSPSSPEASAAAAGDATAGMAACYALVTQERHHRFLATLLSRPPARWCNVAELCHTSGTAPPASLPPQPLFCTWTDHPWGDPGLAAVVFVSLQDGSNTVALCRRVNW